MAQIWKGRPYYLSSGDFWRLPLSFPQSCCRDSSRKFSGPFFFFASRNYWEYTFKLTLFESQTQKTAVVNWVLWLWFQTALNMPSSRVTRGCQFPHGCSLALGLDRRVPYGVSTQATRKIANRHQLWAKIWRNISLLGPSFPLPFSKPFIRDWYIIYF